MQKKKNNNITLNSFRRWANVKIMQQDEQPGFKGLKIGMTALRTYMEQFNFQTKQKQGR